MFFLLSLLALFHSFLLSLTTLESDLQRHPKKYTFFLHLRTQSEAGRGEGTYVNGVNGSELLQQTGHVLLLGPLVQLAHPQSGAAHWETKETRQAE